MFPVLSGKIMETADTVLKNGKIYTVDPKNSWADTLAIKGGKILSIGSMETVKMFIGDQTEILDLQGKMVLPGFVDAHMHPLMSADIYFNQVKLFDLPNREVMLSAIKEFTDSHPEHSVIRGGGYNRSIFDKTGPRKEWLDTIENRRPVYIVSGDGHSAWVNSVALKRAGISRDTPQPKDGIIMKDPVTGEPSGLLQEKGAMNMVANLLPRVTKDRYKHDILELEKYFGKTGITTVFDAKIPLDEENYWMAYKECAEEGKLTWRYRGGWYIDPAKDVREEILKGCELSKKVNTTSSFQIHAFKFFLDEVAEERTSYMLEPFEGETEYRGFKNFDDTQLLDAFVLADKKGFQIHCHQIGDAAARYGLDALEKLEKINGKKDRRPSFAHCQWVSEKDKERMAEYGVTSILSSYWLATDDYYWDLYLPYVGEKRVDTMYPVQTLFDKNINMAVHSDFYVSEPDPLYAIYSGITRNLPERIFNERYAQNPEYKRIVHPKDHYIKNEVGPLPPFHERATLAEMIYAFTMGGARSMFLENEIGSLEAGKKADLVILEKNLFDIPVEKIPDIKIEMVYFEGKITYISAPKG